MYLLCPDYLLDMYKIFLAAAEKIRMIQIKLFH